MVEVRELKKMHPQRIAVGWCQCFSICQAGPKAKSDVATAAA
jgi:hypothetical protein